MESIKVKSYKGLLIILMMIFIVCGFILGLSIDKFTENENISIVVNGENQIFRDSNGKAINVLEKNGVIYMPVNGLGSYLDYMTINDEKGLSFYKVENEFQGSLQSQKIFEGLSTKTIYGEEVTDSVFSNSNYTAVLLWATWCKYCQAEIESFVELNDYLDKNDIQFVSIVTDLPGAEDNFLTAEHIETVNSIVGDFKMDYILLRNTFINQNFIKGSLSLPKLYIIDNSGSLIKVIDDDITSEQFIEIFDAILE